MNDDVIGRARNVIVRSWARPVSATAEEVIHERNMAWIAATALQQSGLLNTNNPDAVADIVKALAKEHGELQDRIEAALAELDQCAIEGHWSGTLVARIRAALTGKEEQ